MDFAVDDLRMRRDIQKDAIRERKREKWAGPVTSAVRTIAGSTMGAVEGIGRAASGFGSGVDMEPYRSPKGPSVLPSTNISQDPSAGRTSLFPVSRPSSPGVRTPQDDGLGNLRRLQTAGGRGATGGMDLSSLRNLQTQRGPKGPSLFPAVRRPQERTSSELPGRRPGSNLGRGSKTYNESMRKMRKRLFG